MRESVPFEFGGLLRRTLLVVFSQSTECRMFDVVFGCCVFSTLFVLCAHAHFFFGRHC